MAMPCFDWYVLCEAFSLILTQVVVASVVSVMVDDKMVAGKMVVEEERDVLVVDNRDMVVVVGTVEMAVLVANEGDVLLVAEHGVRAVDKMADEKLVACKISMKLHVPPMAGLGLLQCCC